MTSAGYFNRFYVYGQARAPRLGSFLQFALSEGVWEEGRSTGG